MKERAKAIAMSDPGQPVSAPYSPSQEAQSDTDLAAQEKEAWDDLIEDMNDGAEQSDAGEQSAKNQGQAKGDSQDQTSSSQTAGASGQSSSSQGQSDGQSSNGPLRGGSSESVSDILAQIKGLKSGSGKVSGSAGGENSSLTKASESTSQGQKGSAGEAAQSGKQGDSVLTGQQNQSEGGAQSQDNPASTPEAISPLDYIRNQRSSQSGGQKSSASDFLKKKQD